MFLDSDNAGDKVSHRSYIGFMMYVNTALVQWISKKQSTDKKSVFGSKFVALKHGIEALQGLRYKLRMMGIPISSPSYIYGDNMSVTHNSSKPESVLRKKSNSVCYHTVLESVAMGDSLVRHITSKENVAYLLTKVLNGQKRKHLVSNILYDAYDNH